MTSTPDISSVEEVKPCPKCGYVWPSGMEPEAYCHHTWPNGSEEWLVVCLRCKHDGPLKARPEWAITAWNEAAAQPSAEQRLTALETAIDQLQRREAAYREVLRAIISNANEAPRFGPFDQIDNTGQPYQSEAFHDALKAGRDLLARTLLSNTGG